MYLIVIGWLYVVLMMAVAEATNTTGTLIGAVFTFVLYGALPVSLAVYLFGRPGRAKAIRSRQAAELAQCMATRSQPPDAGGEAAADTVAPMRKEP